MNTTKLTTDKQYVLESLEFVRWSNGYPTYGGISFDEYFDTNGRYLGPDKYGVEPLFAAVRKEKMFYVIVRNVMNDSLDGVNIVHTVHQNHEEAVTELQRIENRIASAKSKWKQLQKKTDELFASAGLDRYGLVTQEKERIHEEAESLVGWTSEHQQWFLDGQPKVIVR